MQGHRIRRGQRARDRPRRRDDAEGAKRSGLGAERGPNLTHEIGDRGLAARSGDRDDCSGLARDTSAPTRGPRALRTSAALMKAAGAMGPAGARSATIATAPALNRLRREDEAVLFVPGSAKKTMSAVTARLSALTPVISRPAKASGISARGNNSATHQ